MMEDDRQPPVAPLDEALLEPTPVWAEPELGARVRQSHRRRQLFFLWSVVVVLLVAQAAIAVHSALQRRREEGAPAGSGARATASTAAFRSTTAVSTRPRSTTALSGGAAARADGGASGAPVSDGAPVARSTLDAGSRPSSVASTPRRAPAARERGSRLAVARRPAARRSAGPRTPARPLPAASAVDLTLPTRVVGNVARGAQVLRLGCSLCHGRNTRAIDPGRRSAREWSAYFAAGSHGSHDRLRPHFTRGELADVKAFLMSAAGKK